MSGCIGCSDSFSYEVLSDGTIIMQLERDGITSEKVTSRAELGLSEHLDDLAFDHAMEQHEKEMIRERDISDRS